MHLYAISGGGGCPDRCTTRPIATTGLAEFRPDGSAGRRVLLCLDPPAAEARQAAGPVGQRAQGGRQGRDGQRHSSALVITVKDNTVSLNSADAKMEVIKASVTQILESGTATESSQAIMKQNNRWRFILVILIVAWSLYEIYPPTSNRWRRNSPRARKTRTLRSRTSWSG